MDIPDGLQAVPHGGARPFPTSLSRICFFAGIKFGPERGQQRRVGRQSATGLQLQERKVRPGPIPIINAVPSVGGGSIEFITAKDIEWKGGFGRRVFSDCRYDEWLELVLHFYLEGLSDHIDLAEDPSSGIHGQNHTVDVLQRGRRIAGS